MLIILQRNARFQLACLLTKTVLVHLQSPPSDEAGKKAPINIIFSGVNAGELVSKDCNEIIRKIEQADVPDGFVSIARLPQFEWLPALQAQMKKLQVQTHPDQGGSAHCDH